MAEAQSIFSKVLLAFQLCLGLWQILKLTPFGAFIKGLMGWSMSLLPLGLGTLLSPSYSRLQFRPGRVFKHAECLVLKPTQYFKETSRPLPEEIPDQMEWRYLNVDYNLERREGNKLFINGTMSYYVTNRSLFTLSTMYFMRRDADRPRIFVKGYKRFWKGVATAGVMSLSQVLDYLILEDQIVSNLTEGLLLPVDLSVSEEKLLKCLNLIGLFLQTRKKIHWLIPTILSFVAAVLEFSTPLRVFIYGKINLLFCLTVQPLCDRLPYSRRRKLYSLGDWVENLMPSNDVEMRIVKGEIFAVIGGGAKATDGATLVHPPPFYFRDANNLGFPEEVVTYTFDCGLIYLSCIFDTTTGRCVVAKDTRRLDRFLHFIHRFHCNMDQFRWVTLFVFSLAKYRSGSLKSCRPDNSVHVRDLMKTIAHYVNNDFPPVYELRLENAVIR